MDNSLEIVLSLSLPPPPPCSSYHSQALAPVDGYQWMGNYLVLATFPLTNGHGNCITSTPTCTAAFNSTIIMAPAVIPDLLSGYRHRLLDVHVHHLVSEITLHQD